jgi:hypothetical protein
MRAQHIGTRESFLSSFEQRLSSFYESLKIVLTDLLPTNCTHMLPNALAWGYRTFWTGSIQSETLADSSGKVASFYTHVRPPVPRNEPTQAILLLHGDHAHPFSLLHLADLAQREGYAIFSVWLPYDDANPGPHQTLIQKSIEKIEQIVARGRSNEMILSLVGHSRGAIEAANQIDHSRVSRVISFAGRFRVLDNTPRPCRESLKPTVDAVWEKVKPSRPLRIPFCQIAASEDWCIDNAASIVRQDQPNCTVNAGHLGVLASPAALAQFTQWIKS